MSNQQRKQGVLILWKKDRGFGIIQTGGPASLEKYFLHTKFIRSGTACPEVGQTVYFEVSPEPIRRENELPAAIRVDIVVNAPTTAASSLGVQS